MTAIATDALNSNTTCGYPRADSFQLLRDPVNSDMPWAGFLFGQTPASIWYWCADQVCMWLGNLLLKFRFPEFQQNFLLPRTTFWIIFQAADRYITAKQIHHTKMLSWILRHKKYTFAPRLEQSLATWQVIVQRALAAKSLSHAQGATLLAGYIKILPLFTLVMPGMISRILSPGTNLLYFLEKLPHVLISFLCVWSRGVLHQRGWGGVGHLILLIDLHLFSSCSLYLLCSADQQWYMASFLAFPLCAMNGLIKLVSARPSPQTWLFLQCWCGEFEKGMFACKYFKYKTFIFLFLGRACCMCGSQEMHGNLRQLSGLLKHRLSRVGAGADADWWVELVGRKGVGRKRGVGAWGDGWWTWGK